MPNPMHPGRVQASGRADVPASRKTRLNGLPTRVPRADGATSPSGPTVAASRHGGEESGSALYYLTQRAGLGEAQPG